VIGAKVSAAEFMKIVADEMTKVDLKSVDRLADALHERYLSRRFVYIIGNGGSGSNASHFCEDLAKSSVRDFDAQKRLKVLSLTDNTPAILAWGNDTSYDRIFVEQLKNYAEPGDMLVAISGSGNSPNILRAVEWANQNGVRTFGVTGFSGGRLRELANDVMHVPCEDMGIVESIHLILFHYALDDLYGRINLGKKRVA
jgi:D-sedoheptulose 7-phosphate isomerase